MLLVPNLNSMTTTAPPHGERPDAGANIRARRAWLKKSRPAIETETDNVLYTELQKRIEDGEKKVRTLHVRHITAYLEALQWTAADWERETGITLPESDPVPGSEPYEGGVPVAYYGAVSAGLINVMDEAPESYINLDPSLPGMRGKTGKHLGLLRVNGDSMISDNAVKSVPEGSMVLVEWGAAPVDDDLVVAWLEDHSTAVLKQYREGRDIVLRSFNPRGPVFRASDDIDVRGVVRLIIRRP